jgi:hypothetical protein
MQKGVDMENNNVIYDAANQGYATVGVAFYIFVALVLIGIVYLIFQIKQKAPFSSKLGAIIVIVFFSGAILVQIVTVKNVNKEVYDEYLSGNYEIVEGEISDYERKEESHWRGDCDYFYVNGIEFSITPMGVPWGYPLKQSEGGVLKDGMYVKIFYVEYTYQNIIMRIET